jgi:tRNA G18 (ribose-2'-O)-methylase SpoU
MRTLHLIANNIRSAENVGSLFRTADSLGVSKLWITGYSPTPEHPKVEKTALGAESAIPWEQATDVVDVIQRLKSEGFRIVGLELDRRSVNLTEFHPPEWTALLLGNEVEGIPPFLLDQCDDVVSISQKGMKESMNVGVAAAIASFWMLNLR